MVNENIEKRKEEVPKIQGIIAEEVAELERWNSSLQATPTIAALNELIEHIRKDEVEKNINRFDAKDRELVELVTKRIVNKILHTPIVNLRNGHDDSHTERQQKISFVRRLFGIDTEGKERSNGS